MNDMAGTEFLGHVYALIAELWCSPPDSDVERDEGKQVAGEVINSLQTIDAESATLLARFLSENDTTEEEYIELFELDPQCSLYLGSHTYDEPDTCANAAVSDRNGYMIELIGIYKHFGQQPTGKELPDYLPMMVDFLALSTGSMEDPVRDKLINEYFLPFLPPLRHRLEELRTPYLHLLDALANVISIEKSATQMETT
jgi:nitrate reductase delta subunit